MSYEGLRGMRILVIDDDPTVIDFLRKNLESIGCLITTARDMRSAKKSIDELELPFEVAIVDFYIPEKPGDDLDHIMRGEALAHYIRRSSPSTKIVGLSGYIDKLPLGVLHDLYSDFLHKPDLMMGFSPVQLFETLDALVGTDGMRQRLFIAHGKDEEAVQELRSELENLLPRSEIIVLREAAGNTQSIFDVFEAEVRRVDAAFILLTPDDSCEQPHGREERRARQNVILELGYFLGRFHRHSGRVILLKHADVDCPSNINGLRYIDITEGIASKREEMCVALRQLGLIRN
jgi:predicted nucleotide-binding protein